MSAPPNRALTLGGDPADRNWTEPEVTAAKEFTPPPMCMASISMPYLAKIPASLPMGMTLELIETDPRATRIFSRGCASANLGGPRGSNEKHRIATAKISLILDLRRRWKLFRNGETVLVLDRKVPVAELKPVTGRSSTGKLVALERKGIIRLGTGEISEKFFKAKLGGKRARTLEALLEERKKGR